MNHIQITIEASEAQQELLIAFLSEVEAVGFEQTEKKLLAYFDETSFRSDEVKQVLKGYVFEIETLAEKNWNAEWERHFDPVIVDDFCAVRAHFHLPIEGVTHQILITPKMSFGTGHHATTFMMMQQMREIDFNNKTVFDFGTGTGVLAILAEKLGASSVFAIDNDGWSIENAKENITNNHCKNVEVKLASILPQDQQFDIVLANINRNVILQHLPALKKSLEMNGLILLSGLLLSDEQTLIETCISNGLKLLTRMEKLNWISLLFVNCR